MKPYQAALMEHIWEINEEDRTGIISREAHEYLIDTGEDELKISRASVIIFLDAMVEEGVLEYETETGKGGYHRVYFPAMKPKQFESYVTNAIMEKLKEVFAASRKS
jgi:predicted transcriptional regulator